MTAELVIVDLDDTLWQWCRTWHAGYLAFNDVLERRHGATLGETEDAWTQMYARRDGETIEFPPDVIDLRRCVWPEMDAGTLGEIHRQAVRASREARDAELVLFDGVADTLRILNEAGVPVIAHTDSPVTAAESRLHLAGLDGLVDELHARPIFDDFGAPGLLEHTTTVITAGWEAKPSTHVLRQVLRNRGVDPSRTLYVGDSKRRDLPMALDCGCVGVWARYGVEYPQREPAIDVLLRLQRLRPFPAEHSLEADARNGLGRTETIDSFSQVIELAFSGN